MKDSMKTTVFYQCMYMLFMQLVASGIAFLFGIVVFWYFLSLPIAREIVGVAFITLNFVMLYISAKKFANRDCKTYTPLNKNLFKGVMFGVIIAVINILLLALFRLVWTKYAVDGNLYGAMPTVANALVYLWTFPYNGIMYMTCGHVSIVSEVAVVIVPIAATTLGYIAGCKNFELAEKLDEFIYEKEEE